MTSNTDRATTARSSPRVGLSALLRVAMPLGFAVLAWVLVEAAFGDAFMGHDAMAALALFFGWVVKGLSAISAACLGALLAPATRSRWATRFLVGLMLASGGLAAWMLHGA